MFNLTSLLLLYNIIKVGTIKALASKAIFIITKVRAKAIKGIILRVISIRLFGPKTY
jgi:flagellar motor switch protein FliG